METRATWYLGRCALAILLVVVCFAPRSAPADSPRIVAIGDVHGNLDGLVGILRRAGLTNQAGKWTGGRATLVQTGDFTDRGPRVRGVMDLLMSLRASAHAAGGEVHVLLGNHEGMNLLTETRDVSAETLSEFADARSEQRRNEQYDRYVTRSAERSAKFEQPPPLYQPAPREQWLAAHPPGFVEYVEALGPEGTYGRWLRSLPIVIKVGDAVFMHAGINPDRAPMRLTEINETVRGEVARFDKLRKALIVEGWAIPAFTLRETIVAARLARLANGNAARWDEGVPAQDWALLDPEGPLWFRGFATARSADLRAPINKLLERYSARRFVIGHSTLASGRILQRLDGRLVLIDTGMLSSHYRGGRPSALEIQDGRLRAIYEDEAKPIDQEPNPVPSVPSLPAARGP